MNELKTLITDNLSGFSPKSIPSFLFAFFVCAVLAFLLGRMYVRYGNSMSNRKAFSLNFVVLAITTMFVITVVKSSLALSLGLVGALSIVRFRSAIKEPEELTYLFLTISIGLGCGAGLTVLTVLAFLGFFLIVWFNHRFRKETIAGQSLYLTISSGGGNAVDLGSIIEVLKMYCDGLKLKRTDEGPQSMEASFFIEISDINRLQEAKDALRSLYPSVNITFMDASRDV